MATALSPEFELLAACCSMTPEFQPALNLAVDWQRFIALVERHGVIAQAYEQLSRDAAVPQPAVAALRQTHEHNLRRTLWLTREFTRIVKELQAQHIPVLPYKGPVLADLLYGNVTARQFSDLDFIVRAPDVGRAKSALHQLGYTSHLQLTERQEREYLHSGYEYSFDGVHGPNLVELQWQILPRFYAVDFQMAGLFQRATRVEVAGLEVQTLSPEDLLLTLCVHAAKHAWERLSWLCDIARLAQARIVWPLVEKEAHRLGVWRIVSITFRLIKRFLGTESPIALDPDQENLSGIVSRYLTGEEVLDAEGADYFKLMMKIREHAKDRMRFISRLLFTAGVGEWQSVRLPDSLLPLYRGVRVFRVVRRLAK
jgi:hypothetical protein